MKNKKDVPERSENGRVLSSWKEIADYLQVDVRTCQRWENAYDLPVHRNHKARYSRVIAYTNEIDGWRARTFQPRSGASDPGASPSPPGSGFRYASERGDDQSGSRRSIWRRPGRLALFSASALVLLASLGVLSGVLPRVLSSPKTPFDFSIQDTFLVIHNARGRALWRSDTGLDNLQSETYIRARFQKKRIIDPKIDLRPSSPVLIIKDLNGDRRKEVLFAPPTIDEMGADVLLAFKDFGDPLFEPFHCGQAVRVGDREYPPDFVIDHLAAEDLTGDGICEILIIAHSLHEAPTRILVLDLKGRILGEYWHFGQITDYVFLDYDGQGFRDIGLAGQNNGNEGPCFFILDPADMRGGSFQGPEYAFAEMETGTEKLYLQFCTTELDRVVYKATRASFVKCTLMENGTIELETKDTLVKYILNPRTQYIGVSLSDHFKNNWRAAYSQGQIAQELNEKALKKELAEKIFILRKNHLAPLSSDRNPDK